MAVTIEERIDEVCDLAAREPNYTKLKSVIEQLLHRRQATATRRGEEGFSSNNRSV
jgi:hypothetical protein